MNDKDKQRVCNKISTSVWEFYKITMRISQLYRNFHRDRTTFLLDLTIRSCIVKISDRLFRHKCYPLLCNYYSQVNILEVTGSTTVDLILAVLDNHGTFQC